MLLVVLSLVKAYCCPSGIKSAGLEEPECLNAVKAAQRQVGNTARNGAEQDVVTPFHTLVSRPQVLKVKNVHQPLRLLPKLNSGNPTFCNHF
jgi:hypothetical protein